MGTKTARSIASWLPNLRGRVGVLPRKIAHMAGQMMTPAGMQFAALAYRLDEDGTSRVMLITSRETRRWVIPKGWPMKGLHPSRVAEREAYEEAGLVGQISRQAVGAYRYDKRDAGVRRRCQVWVFLLRVDYQVSDWPERAQRETRWFRREEAAALVAEPDLRKLILNPKSFSHAGDR